MSCIQVNQWSTPVIKQFEEVSGQALLSDEQTLVSFSQDFGKLIQSYPAAVSLPKNTNELVALIQFANQHKLPITIRGNGLSQCGQSLANQGGLIVSMQNFCKPLELTADAIWVEANTSWASLLEVSLRESKAPYVLPYNCNLSVGGVLSAGGIGASSFKYGSINAHVKALEVIDGSGLIQVVDKASPLFHACLSGQGRCAVITKAQIQLRPVKSHVTTFCLVYASQKQWFDDLAKVREKADYLEMFCSPSIQGMQIRGNQRLPMAQWLYGMHISVEHNGKPPELKDLVGGLKYWNLLTTLEESISSYLLRHNPRFEMMKKLGQWDLFHPWYECFMPTKYLREHLEDIIQELPLHYANMVHIVPIGQQKADFLMFPDTDSVCEIMILNPGVPFSMKDSCLQVIEDLDSRLMQEGGKRYLSGFIGQNLSKNYWVNHFGEQHELWVDLKSRYDPAGIFSSVLHKSEPRA